MRIPFGKPILGDLERGVVNDVLSGTTLVHGPRTVAFEEDFSGFVNGGHCTAVSSCTAGLHLFYFDMALQPGDEVIVPAQTHVATVHAVLLAGGTPVFVDAEPVTGNIDIDQIEAAITDRTRAISVVHYLGMPVDMDRINAIATKHQLKVLEDAALAIGAYYKGTHAGLLGDAGAFSFYPAKHMTTLEGGMVLSKDAAFVERAKRKKAFGVDRVVSERKIPGFYDVKQLGFNYRMNEVQAAIGSAQITRLPGFLRKRAENYRFLQTHLADINEIDLFDIDREGFQSAHYCFSFVLSDALAPKRLDIIEWLNAKGVGTSIYYPGPVPHTSFYKEKYGVGENDYPVAKKISTQSIALPVGPHLNLDDMSFVVNHVKEAILNAA